MTIRIETEAHRLKTVIRVSGRLQSKHLDALKTQLEGAQSPPVAARARHYQGG